MAGPNLTPETFARGLQETVFPNPAHPNLPGAVGFRGNHSMAVDGAEWWWSNSARSPYREGGSGTVCYVDGGVRHRKGSWPEGEGKLFEPPCHNGTEPGPSR